MGRRILINVTLTFVRLMQEVWYIPASSWEWWCTHGNQIQAKFHKVNSALLRVWPVAGVCPGLPVCPGRGSHITLGEWGPGHVAATSANTSLTSEVLVTKLGGVCDKSKTAFQDIVVKFEDQLLVLPLVFVLTVQVTPESKPILNIL